MNCSTRHVILGGFVLGNEQIDDRWRLDFLQVGQGGFDKVENIENV